MSDPEHHYVKIGTPYQGTAGLTALVQQYVQWCEGNAGVRNIDWDYIGLGVFRFVDPKQAVRFKLMYG